MAEEALIDWQWILEHGDEIANRLVQHLQLTVVAVAVGLLISLPAGVLAFRHRWFYAPATWTAGILYSIPSLALFVMLIPVTGLSMTTAEIGLVGYTLLILIRNVVAGLTGVPGDARAAAVAMGYTKGQLLWGVELPLALPAILAGIRIATVTTIGLVTVTALIGLGGLGYFIVDLGLGRFNETAIIVGSLLSILLALVADGTLLLLQRLLTPWARGRSMETFV